MDSENTGTTLRALNIKIIFLKHDSHHTAVVSDCPAWGLRPDRYRIYGHPDLHSNVILPLISCVLWGEVCTSLSLFPYLSQKKHPKPPKVIAKIRWNMRFKVNCTVITFQSNYGYLPFYLFSICSLPFIILFHVSAFFSMIWMYISIPCHIFLRCSTIYFYMLLVVVPGVLIYVFKLK